MEGAGGAKKNHSHRRDVEGLAMLWWFAFIQNPVL
jgi:hypothetical protein